MTPAQERQAYEEKRNKLARELLPTALHVAVTRYPLSPAEDVHAQAAADALEVAEEFLRRCGEAPPYEAQIAEALKYLRDPERIYENRVSAAISTLMDKSYGEQDWRAWQYRGAPTMRYFVIRNTETPEPTYVRACSPGPFATYFCIPFEDATRWATEDEARTWLHHQCPEEERRGLHVVEITVNIPR